MKVNFKFFTSLREITGKREEELESRMVLTLEEALRAVSEKHGRLFEQYVFDEKGNVRSHLLFLVNGRSITLLQGLNTKLRDGDEIAILPPVGGGYTFYCDHHLTHRLG